MTDNKTGAALSPQFVDSLKVMQDIMPSKVNEKLIQGFNDNTLDVSKMYFITPSLDLTKLNFVKFGKPILAEDGTPNVKGMGDAKLVRVLRSLLSSELENKNLVDKDFEIFHNIYTSFFSTKDGEIVIWSGDLIDKAYCEQNYYAGDNPELYCCNCDYHENECECEPEDQDLMPTDDIDRGTLWESCMRHQSCIDGNYFQLYKEHASIAVLYCNDKIRARALVWTTEEGITFMDRIYATEDRLIQKMIAFARLNKWDYKEEQSYSNKTGFYHYDTKLKAYRKAYWTHRIKLSKDSLINISNMPYMDTLTYLYVDMSNNEPYLINNFSKVRGISKYSELTGTSGSWDKSSYIKTCSNGCKVFITDKCNCVTDRSPVSITTEHYVNNTIEHSVTHNDSLDFNFSHLNNWNVVELPEVSEVSDPQAPNLSRPVIRRSRAYWDIETDSPSLDVIRDISQYSNVGDFCTQLESRVPLSSINIPYIDHIEYLRAYIQSPLPSVDEVELSQTEETQQETSDF